jgi:hypothetical protein
MESRSLVLKWRGKSKKRILATHAHTAELHPVYNDLISEIVTKDELPTPFRHAPR